MNPIFTIRAKDPIAAETIRFWIRLRELRVDIETLSGEKYAREIARRAEAECCLESVRDWKLVEMAAEVAKRCPGCGVFPGAPHFEGCLG